LGRFAKRINIYFNQVDLTPVTKYAHCTLRDVLLAFSRGLQLGEELEENIIEQMTPPQIISNNVNIEDDGFVQEDEPEHPDLFKLMTVFIIKLGEDNPLVTLFKVTFCQSILSPVWLWIKFNLLVKFPFIDTKLGNVLVRFSEEKIIVVHQRTEQSKDDPTHVGDPNFLFQWELQLVFTTNMKKLLDSSFSITSATLSPKMDNTKSKKFKKIIQEWQEASSFVPQEDRFQRASSPRKRSKKSRSRNSSPKARKKELPKKSNSNYLRKVPSEPMTLRHVVVVEKPKVGAGTEEYKAKKSPGKKDAGYKNKEAPSKFGIGWCI